MRFLFYLVYDRAGFSIDGIDRFVQVGDDRLSVPAAPDKAHGGADLGEHTAGGKLTFGDIPLRLINGHAVDGAGVWSTDEEIALMKERGVFIAHCPASNMNVASGIAPIRRYLDEGLRVGLGSDIAGGHSTSIFTAMVDAMQVSRLYWRHIDQSRKPLSFPEALYMATKGGGAFFGKAGSFERGFEFDAIVIDDSVLPHPQDLTVAQRAERAVWLGGDRKGLVAKYVRGKRIL